MTVHSLTKRFSPEEQRIYGLIARSDGLKAREIAKTLGMNHTEGTRFGIPGAG